MGAVVLAFALKGAAWAARTIHLPRSRPLHKAAGDLQLALGAARLDGQAAREAFERIKRELENHRNEYERLRDSYEKELDGLRVKSKSVQLQAHLAQFPLRSVHLRLIGPNLVSTLESYGVDSAAAIEYNRVRYVKGIGPKRADALVAWRRRCESAFKFDPHHGVDPGKLAALRQRYMARHEAVATALAAGPRALSTASAAAEKIAADRMSAIQALIQQAADLLPQP